MMKKLILAFLLVTPLSAAWGAPPPTLQRIHEVRMQHPEMPGQLLSHLRAKYPDLENRAARVVLNLGDKYPGLPYGLARHMLEDLQGEPALAFHDVAEAAVAKYPTLPQRLMELRANVKPRRQVAAMVAERYPGLRTEVLRLGRPIQTDVRHVLREEFAPVRREVLLEVSTLIDEKYPRLPIEIWRERGDERPITYVLRKHPDFVREAANRIRTKHGEALRQAAVRALARLEKDEQAQPAAWLKKAQQMVSSKFPGLLKDAVDARVQARQRMRAAVRAEFPELGKVVVETMRAKHPELLGKAFTTMDKHYPTLRQDARTAFEAEFPGIEKETLEFLQRY